MDYYLDSKNATDRLVDEWSKYGKIIIAYDFDDTVYDFHNKGRTYNDVIQLLRGCREYGAHFVVFTACGKDEEDKIENYLNTNDVPYDRINDNLDFITFTGRKIYYNILLDDRSGLESAYNILKETLAELKKRDAYKHEMQLF